MIFMIVMVQLYTHCVIHLRCVIICTCTPMHKGITKSGGGGGGGGEGGGSST